jgi:surfactin synthase thioesterase subunit
MPLTVWAKVAAAVAHASTGTNATEVLLLSSGLAGKLSILSVASTPLGLSCAVMGCLLAFYVASTIEKQIKEFEYLEFSHAENH